MASCLSGQGHENNWWKEPEGLYFAVKPKHAILPSVLGPLLPRGVCATLACATGHGPEAKL